MIRTIATIAAATALALGAAPAQAEMVMCGGFLANATTRANTDGLPDVRLGFLATGQVYTFRHVPGSEIYRDNRGQNNAITLNGGRLTIRNLDNGSTVVCNVL